MNHPHRPLSGQEIHQIASSHGKLGEDLAAAFLEDTKGFKIVERNWRNPSDHREELDLVAWDEEILVIVEVKTRDRTALVPGYYHVDQAKRKVLRRAVRAYLKSLHINVNTIRFEVIEIELGQSEPEIRHYSPVPLFGDHVIL